jgi:G3E family GTPase
MEGESRLPVTIVTGFLGSGKTTLLNHILAQQHGLRIAVMVNEIGDLAIDNELIIGAASDMVELSNGCICCSINNDLVDAIFRVLRNEPPVEYLIVETTGLADPLPIVLTFLRSEFRNAVRVDSIVAVADAENFSLDLFDSRAAANQLRYADVVLLNKCDLVGPVVAAAIEEKIRAISERGRIVRTTRARIPLPLVLSAGLFQSDRYLADHDHDHDHLAGDGFDAVSFDTAAPFEADLFQSFLEGMPRNVFRGKGILWIEGNDERHVFHLVGGRFTLDESPGVGHKRNRLVLIGQNLDGKELRARLASCVATPTIPAPG